ncbi:TonB-dependent receptor [Undibacterium sp. TS12]|uniref:TonB-dependent receptor n=1 Tax=Undibacterium sp. TS12 TaxID=2908202 RepID=UPI001F4C8358|nr:TonB-dependent receptor [Undibacterium sp. TS12]MCH8617983.1 TonB-dependent receptor [Undibacterium sp. TS12]
MKEKVLSHSLRMMSISGMSLALISGVQAQDNRTDNAAMQRVEVTGSSIKRINQETALPVQTLTRADIEKSGATNVESLIAALPSMQGFATANQTINGGGGGLQTASIHNIGAAYTLVLLNGHRLASYGAGSTVNLASIPLSAVERVEILTDGASTLYGSDAIAGVVNFILRKNQTDAAIDVSYARPQESGGKSYRIGLSKGFGELEKDGYNVLLSYSHDEQSMLNAGQRSFADTGVRRFSANGKNYATWFLSDNSSPAIAQLNFKNGADPILFSPSYLKDKTCAPNTFQVENRCRFDYASTVQLIPESKRDSLFSSLNYRLNSDTNLFAEAVVSNFKQTGRYAPAAQPLSLGLDSALFAKYVTPYLGTLGVNPADLDSARMRLRISDAGGRNTAYTTEAQHLVLGADGNAFGFDYNLSYTHSISKRSRDFAGGFLSKDKFYAIVDSGKYDPFAPAGSSSAILAPAVLHENWSSSKSTLDVLSLRGSRELFQLGGGKSQLGLGADFSKQRYDYFATPIGMGTNALQPNYTDAPLGDSPGDLPIAASRKNWGSFAELLLPVSKQFDVTAALRYDDYSAVTNSANFDEQGKPIASATQGNKADKLTYKLSAAYRAFDNLLLRGSYGTGFKMASMSDITSPLTHSGNTGGTYPCPVKAPDPRAVNCMGATQYDVLTGGNRLTGENGLKPEESKQATLGMRLEPLSNLSLGFDLWDVKMENQIAQLPEALVFGHPERYQNLFSTFYEQGQGGNILVGTLPSYNIASAHYRGIDWDHNFKTSTPLGKLNVNWTGTYLLMSDLDIPGSPTVHSVGRYDENNAVAFRIISKLVATLKTSDMFSHTLSMNYRSGYHDASASVREVNANGSFGDFVTVKRDVASYTTFNWQTRVQLQKKMALSFGIHNLFNVNPPLSLKEGNGDQVGYDGRYTDALGRTFYMTGSYSF